MIAIRSGEKLTAAQVSAVQSQIEDALKEPVIKINALKIRPTNSGPAAVEVASEAEAEEAIDQLSTVAHVTGYTAKGIAEKHARLIIKNTPNDRLPADAIDTLNRNYEQINTILENNRCSGSSVI